MYVTFPQWFETFPNMSDLRSGRNRAKCGLVLNDPIDWFKLRLNQPKSKNAIMGPYDKIPFSSASKVGISPLSTRPKRDSQDRRVILDLSFPSGESVNDGMTKDHYLGFEAKLTFPKVDELALRIHQLGEGCLMFKVDLSRYFRQLPLDPANYLSTFEVVRPNIWMPSW